MPSSAPDTLRNRRPLYIDVKIRSAQWSARCRLAAQCPPDRRTKVLQVRDEELVVEGDAYSSPYQGEALTILIELPHEAQLLGGRGRTKGEST